jgi:hypothetical protein
LGFSASARGYAYYLEGIGEITKGEFDKAAALITECRKDGSLPYDVCAPDETREATGLERLDHADIGDEAQRALRFLRTWHEDYAPFSFWDDQEVYIEVAVEKGDLRNLFAPVCERFRIPITNMKGWSDLNCRVKMMKRFAEHEAEGRRCVLLVCGDHDPGGLQITGFNRDFIDRNGLMWIDNLITSSGENLADPRHRDHAKSYVQEYLREHGARKVEANALMARPADARQLCLDAILEYLPADAPDRYLEKLEEHREQLREHIAGLIGDAA